MGAVAIFVVGLYLLSLIVIKLWGQYEIDPEEYHRVAGVLKRYPHLQKHLRTFREDGRITTWERRQIVSEAQALSKRYQTKMDIQARMDLILPLIDDEKPKAMDEPQSRGECIKAIDDAGKRDEFVEIYGRSPEEYFDQYCYREPPAGHRETADGHNIWLAVLGDLQLLIDDE
jgi:hypothetical protein